MSFKYINPGYNAITESNNFTQSTLYGNNSVSLQNVPSTYHTFLVFNVSNKFYFKFNFYWGGGSGWGYLFTFADGSHDEPNIQFMNSTSAQCYFGSKSIGSIFTVSGALITLSGYVDIANGEVAFYANGDQVGAYTGTIFGGVASTIQLKNYTNSFVLFFSDPIVSDKNIFVVKVVVGPITSSVLKGWTYTFDCTSSTGNT